MTLDEFKKLINVNMMFTSNKKLKESKKASTQIMNFRLDVKVLKLTLARLKVKVKEKVRAKFKVIELSKEFFSCQMMCKRCIMNSRVI